MRYLSVCSGIEAASVAWHPLGWTPLAFSEIEPFPRAVLAHHYPDVPCHGDFTVLRDQPWIVDADVLVGGTPCQAFSVAGLRNSLADDRGNLSLEFVRLADAIDDVRHAAGRKPAVIVWENVPGVLSVKDNAFGCFLAALAGDGTPYVPPRRKWTDAGVVDGPQRKIAWRVLDAQYFGLAQRRRRVFVVASARAGFDPAAVLLEFEGVRRDTPPRREARETTAHSTAPCLTSSGRGVERTGDTRGQDPVVAVEGRQWPVDIAPTLNAAFGEKQGLEDQHALGGAGLFVPAPIFATDGQANAAFSVDVALTLNATHEQPYIAAPHIVGALTAKGPEAMGAPEVDGHHYLAVTHSLRGEGFDASEDGTGRGTPLVPVAFSYKDSGADASSDLSPTLRALGAYDANGGGQMGVAYAFQPRIARNGRGDMGEVVIALNAQSGETGKGDAAPCVAISDPVPPLMARSSRGGAQTLSPGHQTDGHMVAQHMAVRRLTPVECERLQGFPDGYTLISWKKKPASECPDGPRYKALGNSMAVPCMRWIGTRIAEALK